MYRSESKISLFLAGFCVLGLMSCKLSRGGNSDPYAMESNDYFKDGKDRFYLAYIGSEQFLTPGLPEKRGAEFLLGLACYGEAPSQKTLVKVPINPDPIKMIIGEKNSPTRSLALNERTMVHEFRLDKDAKNTRGGACEIVLGDTVEPLRVMNDPANYAQGNKVGIYKNTFVAAASCVGASISWLGFLATATAGSAVTAVSGGAASPFAVPVIVSLTIGAISSTGFCVMSGDTLINSVLTYQLQSNKRAFFNAMSKAELIANTYVESNPELTKRMRDYINKDRMRTASALYNPIFVQGFNRFVDDDFENGWGKDTKFFNAVKSLQTQLSTGVLNFHNSSIKCDQPKIDECEKENKGIMVCQEKFCSI